jgi:hypothetical protein
MFQQFCHKEGFLRYCYLYLKIDLDHLRKPGNDELFILLDQMLRNSDALALH